MDRSYEKFRGGPTKPAQDRLHVTINWQNVISLNRNAYKQLGRPPGVYLFFSREQDTIAIEPCPSLRLPEAFPIQDKGASANA